MPALSRQSEPVGRPLRHRALCGLVLTLVALTGCSSAEGSSSQQSPEDGGTGQSSSTSAASNTLSDADLAQILALAVPAAIKANPDGRGEIAAGAGYKVGDALGSVSGDNVTFQDVGSPLSADVQAAVLAAVPKGSVVFSPVDQTTAMLLLATPALSGESVTLTFEQQCGEPGALCGSGGALVIAKVDGEWQIVSGGNSWIS